METALKIDNEYRDLFTGLGCLEGTISLQVKDVAKPYEPLPRCVAYALQEPFKKSWKTTGMQNTGTNRSG